MGLLNMLFRKPANKIDLLALNRDLQILNDCAKLMEDTFSPDVFFPRYALYMEKLSTLSCAQASGAIKVSGDNLVDKYNEMNTAEKKIHVINEFINRYWAHTIESAEKLKTERGKVNRYSKFFDVLSEYEEQMPAECVNYYKQLTPESSVHKARNTIPQERIDKMQRIEANDAYKDIIYHKFYSNYAEKPYISLDRELNTNWIEQAEMFPQQSIIPKSMMKRYADGLLPGHVYMLYWLSKYTNKRIPVYFEYKYGIEFEQEKDFLVANGFLENDQPTKKGLNAIEKHISVINKHQEGNKKPKRDKESIKKQSLEQKKSLVRNGFSFYEYIACKDSCEICKRLDGKVFPISELTPGVNAPPMCDNCRCSISAREDDGNYNAWLDFLSKGGTTEGWNKLRK